MIRPATNVMPMLMNGCCKTQSLTVSISDSFAGDPTIVRFPSESKYYHKVSMSPRMNRLHEVLRPVSWS